MTPALLGRWQTRIFVLGTIGVIVTAIFAASYSDDTFWYVLGYVALFGLGWDILYIAIQQLKWDRDWPPYAQWLAAAWEGFFLYWIIDNMGLPGIDEGIVPQDRFIPHYSTVFITTFIWVQGPMRAIFPFWRFHGGRIV